MVLPMSWGHSSSMGLRALKSKKGFYVSWMSVRLETGPTSILVCGQTQVASTEFPLPHSLPQAPSGLNGQAECRKPGSSQGWVGMAGGSSLGLGKGSAYRVCCTSLCLQGKSSTLELSWFPTSALLVSLGS